MDEQILDEKALEWKEKFDYAIKYYNVQDASIGEQIQAIYMYVSQNYNPNIKGEGYAYFGAGVGQLGGKFWSKSI